MLKISKFARRPFFVEAVEVTADNMQEVANWCNGNVSQNSRGEHYVKVRVHQSRSERQTQAFPGDWVLYANTGFKVYTPRAFDSNFERVDEEPTQITFTKEQADHIGLRPPIEKPQPAFITASQSVKDEVEAELEKLAEN